MGGQSRCIKFAAYYCISLVTVCSTHRQSWEKSPVGHSLSSDILRLTLQFSAGAHIKFNSGMLSEELPRLLLHAKQFALTSEIHFEQSIQNSYWPHLS